MRGGLLHELERTSSPGLNWWTSSALTTSLADVLGIGAAPPSTGPAAGHNVVCLTQGPVMTSAVAGTKTGASALMTDTLGTDDTAQRMRYILDSGAGAKEDSATWWQTGRGGRGRVGGRLSIYRGEGGGTIILFH